VYRPPEQDGPAAAWLGNRRRVPNAVHFDPPGAAPVAFGYNRGMDESNDMSSHNRLGGIALVLSFLGFGGVMLCSAELPVGAFIALLAPVGVIVGIVGLFWPPCRFGCLAVILDVIASMYVPTIWLPFFLRR
jgi:hypothetical protein